MSPRVRRRSALIVGSVLVLALALGVAAARDSCVAKKTPVGGQEWQDAAKAVVERLAALSKEPDAYAQDIIALIRS